MLKMTMVIMAILSINRYLYKTSGSMSKVVSIKGTNCRISVGVERIVFAIRIAWSLILFPWMKRITIPGLLRTPLSLTKNQVLILCWDIHLNNQREIFSLMRLMVTLPISHLLLVIFHHRQIIHLQIFLKMKIYLKRDLKLSLSANTSANNGLN